MRQASKRPTGPSSGVPSRPRQRLLAVLGLMVPRARRAEWLREWAGEFAYDQSARAAKGNGVLRRAAGSVANHVSAFEDALRLRWRTRNGSTLLHDLKIAGRSLAARPMWTIGVVGTLALGIGASTTIFSLVYGVMLRPLPYEDPERLMALDTELTFNLYEGLREQQEVFDDLGAWAVSNRTVRIDQQPEIVRGADVNAALFPTLGIQPLLGRATAEAEDREGAEATVVLSHRLWTTRFAADPEVVGDTLIISDAPHVIVGVMPEGFAFPSADTQLWQSMAHANRSPTAWYLNTVGRVRGGLTMNQATAGLQLAELYDPSTEDGPPERLTISATSLHESTVGSMAPLLLVFQGAVAAVLLIACLNVMNLVMSRAADREQEITVRAALGAGRARLVRLALTETSVLGLLGGALGVGLAVFLIRALLAIAPRAIPLQDRVGLHLPVLLAALGLSLATGLVVGIVPALRAGKLSLRRGLQHGARGFTDSASRHRLRKALVALQLALALTLLVGGGLLLNSFMSLLSVDPGLDPEPVVGIRLALPESSYPGQPSKQVMYAGLLQRLEAIPGVQRAAAAASFPFTGSYSTTTLEIDGFDHGDDEGVRSELQVVTPGYFDTLGIPLLAGRDFTARDTPDNPTVIISDSFARAHFPEGNAIGSRVRGLWTLEETWLTIVGVVGNVQHRGLNIAPAHQVYAPYTIANWPWGMAVTLRVDGNPTDSAGAIRELVADLDNDIPVPTIFPLSQLLSDSVKNQRFFAWLLGGFAATALLLAAIGVYGVVAYGVSSRTRELGIRLALGAEGRRVAREVAWDGVPMALVGLGLGTLAALALGGLLESVLFEVDARDPLVIAIAVGVLLIAAAAASYFPARRASKLDPVDALRG